MFAEGGDAEAIVADIRERSGEAWTPAYSAAIDQLVAAERDRSQARSSRVQTKQRPAPLRRGRGRPGWTRSLFSQRLREAESAASPNRTPAAIADKFRALDGTTGIDPDSLGRLRRKAERGELPE